MIKILFLAPFPPPVTGQAIANQTILDHLSNQYRFDVIDYSKKNLKQGISSFSRIKEVLSVLSIVWKKRNMNEILYMNISQSYSSNIKDLITIFLCRRMKVVVHLHGGGIKDRIFSNNLLRLLNRYIYKYVDDVIVLGESLTDLFNGICNSDKIRVIPNFVGDIFFEKEYISHKSKKMNILFLSNLLPGKGYKELSDAAISICKKRSDVYFNFAGAFDNEQEMNNFLKKIKGIENINYLGIVSGDQKMKLFSEADVFCLPSYFPFEGQPISILEAYASHCAVITTYHNGIVDIFKDGFNGCRVEKKSSDSIANNILELISNPEVIKKYSEINFQYVKNGFTEEKYLKNIKRIFDSII